MIKANWRSYSASASEWGY